MKHNTSVELMHNVWDGLVRDNRQSTDLPKLNYDEILSSIFASGPFYFYIIDFFDLSISNLSSDFSCTHGIEPENVHTINDILALIHPDDVSHVANAERKAFDLIYGSLGVDKITRYKISYNFRFRVADGSYQLFNHQSLILTVDEKGNFIKSLNIHTNIHHITKKNNYKFSLIGLNGEPSYLNLAVDVADETIIDTNDCANFSRRELEIIRLIAAGLETKEIMEKLFIAQDTVKSHRKTILRKAGCKNSAELIARSMSEGWI